MTERPILFSGEMVRAILDGRKTQTRRVITPGTALFDGSSWPKTRPPTDAAWDCAFVDPGPSPAGNRGPYLQLPFPKHDHEVHRIYPRIWAGDRLWVRETWATTEQAGVHPSDAEFVYRATDPAWGTEMVGWKWQPSIFMPRWASRLLLDVVSVRPERLQDISEEDAKTEGVTTDKQRGTVNGEPADLYPMTHKQSFMWLWDSINGKRPGCSWAANPWVWVVSFKRAEGADHG